MIKVVNVELNNKCWKTRYTDSSHTIWYWTCPAVEKFLNEGWNIKDFKMEGSDVIFILEKTDIPNENINNT